MTGDQSRLLEAGDRVCWKNSAADVGTVIATAWSDVTISWDNGHTASIQHNDMSQGDHEKSDGMEWVGTKTMPNVNFSGREQF
jgi:hypothetical protein